MLAEFCATGYGERRACAAAVWASIALIPQVKSCMVVISSTIRMLASESRRGMSSDMCFRRSSAWRSLSFKMANISNIRASATFSRCLTRSLIAAEDYSSLSWLVRPTACLFMSPLRISSMSLMITRQRAGHAHCSLQRAAITPGWAWLRCA